MHLPPIRFLARGFLEHLASQELLPVPLGRRRVVFIERLVLSHGFVFKARPVQRLACIHLWRFIPGETDLARSHAKNIKRPVIGHLLHQQIADWAWRLQEPETASCQGSLEWNPASQEPSFFKSNDPTRRGQGCTEAVEPGAQTGALLKC